MTFSNHEQCEDIELDLFIEALYRKYGMDFRQYSKAHLKRRLLHRASVNGYASISNMQHDLLHTQRLSSQIVSDLSVNVTEMYRDPAFFTELREKIIPRLKTYSKIKIWHAGCSSGEEVYSMAIMLKEAGIYDSCLIYATDFNEKILNIARKAVYPLELAKEYTSNYIESGGKGDFSDYYVADNHVFKLKECLQENIVFANHNLVTDGCFGQMHLIICRNVLIYFERPMQDNVFKLFYESLLPNCMLAIGSKESLQHSSQYKKFKTISSDYPIYQRNI